MKIQVAIDPTYPEDLLIDIKAQTQDPRIGLVESVLDTSEKLLGYQDKDVIILDPKDIYFFATENGKIYAHLEQSKWLVKKKMYELEDSLKTNPDYFLINQGVLANLKKTQKMTLSFSGSLAVVFKNGESEYASRIQTALLKKKLGI